MTSPTRPPMVIGIGNEARGDDGAGRQVARALRSLAGDRVRVLDCSGDAAELLDLWQGGDRVYVVDALRSGAKPGSWRRIAGDELATAVLAPGTSTHGLSIAEAVALGQVLHRMPDRLVVYGIEGTRFAMGTDLSAATARAVDEVTRALADELGLPIPLLHRTEGR
jgi:hydrogenase maturation protease